MAPLVLSLPRGGRLFVNDSGLAKDFLTNLLSSLIVPSHHCVDAQSKFGSTISGPAHFDISTSRVREPSAAGSPWPVASNLSKCLRGASSGGSVHGQYVEEYRKSISSARAKVFGGSTFGGELSDDHDILGTSRSSHEHDPKDCLKGVNSAEPNEDSIDHHVPELDKASISDQEHAGFTLTSEVAKSNVCDEAILTHEHGPKECLKDTYDHDTLEFNKGTASDQPHAGFTVASETTRSLKKCLCCGQQCIPKDVPNTYCLDCEDMMDEAQLGDYS